jgi:hypothetical protein
LIALKLTGSRQAECKADIAKPFILRSSIFLHL